MCFVFPAFVICCYTQLDMFSPIRTTLTQLAIICHLLTCMTPGFAPITVLDILLWFWYIIPSVSFLRKPDTIKPSIKCLLQETFTSWHDIPVISWYERWQSRPSLFFSSTFDRRGNCRNQRRRACWFYSIDTHFELLHKTLLLEEINEVSWYKGIPGNPTSLEKWLVRA